MNNGENNNDFPGPRPDGNPDQNAGNEPGSPDASPPGDPTQAQREIDEFSQNPNEETLTPLVEVSLVRYFNQPGYGREFAESKFEEMNLPQEAKDRILAQISRLEELPPVPDAPDQPDSEPQLSPFGTQLKELGDRVMAGQSVSEALDSLPDELRDTFKKPLEEMEKIATLEATGHEIPQERIEGIKNAFITSGMDLESAEALLIGTNIPDAAKAEIKQKITEREEHQERKEDNEGAMEAVKEAQDRLQEANEMIEDSENLTDEQKASFREKLMTLNLKLEDLGVKKVARGIGKGVAVSILLMLLFMIWELQMIGRVSSKKRG